MAQKCDALQLSEWRRVPKELGELIEMPKAKLG